MEQTETKSKTSTHLNLSEPPLFKVIYVNDDKTSVDFVISSLIDYFEHSHDTAEELTIKIHEQGSGVVAVLPYEIAEQKGIEVTHVARHEGYPLQIKLEPEII